MRRKVVLLSAFEVAAFVWQPALETNAVDVEQHLAQGWSPRPTQAPKALFGRVEIFPRQQDNSLPSDTCGIISSNGNSFTCIDSSATCTYSDDYIGCCNPSSDCNVIKTTCIDYNAVQDGDCDLPEDFHTLCCAESLFPSCYTWTMSSTGTSDAYTFFECSPDAGSGVLLGYDRSATAPSTTGSDSETSTATVTETDATGAKTETGSPTDTENPSPEPTDSNGGGGGGSDTNIGAIVGGAVGGVVALGLVGLAVFLLLRHKRKNEVSPNGSPPVQQVMAQPPPKTQSPSIPGAMYPSGVASGYQGYPQHDPRMSQGYPQHPLQQQYGYAPQLHEYIQYGAIQSGQQNVYGSVAYQPGSASAGSAQPYTTPSPGAIGSQGHTSPIGPQSSANELQTINPVGMETNRVEMG